MQATRRWIILILLLGMVFAGCGDGESDESDVGLANPASVFCEENGGTVEIRTDQAGNQTGFCVFDDGSECDEWAFYRGECSPGG